MNKETVKYSLAYARELDMQDELREYRSKFNIPLQENGKPFIYFCGNSLGIQPKTAESYVTQQLKNWKDLGVEGHFHGETPWTKYQASLRDAMARVVGAKPIEVVVMNALTVNLHLMMISFYQPNGKRNKILIEGDAFPSDKHTVDSQIRLHGLDPKECVIEIKAREGEYCLREEDILETIEQHGSEIALVMMGNTNYYTGQFFNMKKISTVAHANGCKVGFDCAHGAGNVALNLHDSGCDFAVWCNYKYLNSGPGAIGGVFIHERHAQNRDIKRLEGWWGHELETRFNMRGEFTPALGAEAWQLSNPPILSMAPLMASLRLFDEIGMDRLRKKADNLTGYLEILVKSLGDDVINIITPSDKSQRGSQLSIQVKNADKSLFDQISKAGVIVDWREPDVIRVAPTALYNSYEDAYLFYEILKEALS